MQQVNIEAGVVHGGEEDAVTRVSFFNSLITYENTDEF